MEIATEFKDVLEKVLSSIPAGFIFDEVYITDQLLAEYPDEYQKFRTLYGDSEKQMETAAEAICNTIEQFEGSLVEEQKLKILFPTLHGSLSNNKVWKKI